VEEDAPQPKHHTPADSLLSPKLWKHVIFAMLATSLWAGMLYMGHRVDAIGHQFAHIVGLEAGKLTSFFSIASLLAAGQLSLITLWYRSYSRKDFSGGFKLWFWTALGWLGLCAAKATGMHWTAADGVLQGASIQFWQARTLAWLIPSAIIVLALYRLLNREMRDCRLSLWMLRISFLFASTSFVSTLFGDLIFVPQMEMLFSTTASTGWHLSLALSMLFHARHVIHVSNEPPSRPLTRFRLRLPSIALPKFPKRKRKPAKSQQTVKSNIKEEESPTTALKPSKGKLKGRCTKTPASKSERSNEGADSAYE